MGHRLHENQFFDVLFTNECHVTVDRLDKASKGEGV